MNSDKMKHFQEQCVAWQTAYNTILQVEFDRLKFTLLMIIKVIPHWELW